MYSDWVIPQAAMPSAVAVQLEPAAWSHRTTGPVSDTLLHAPAFCHLSNPRPVFLVHKAPIHYTQSKSLSQTNTLLMATTVLANTYSSHVEDEEPIVLSDLVRTAEASRLRRRGAITAAHRARGQLSSTSYVPSDPWLGSPDYRRNRQPIPSQPVIPTQLDSGMPQVYPAWTEVIDPAKVEEESDGGHGSGFELYCGFEETFDDDDVSPYQPSPLPMHSSTTTRPPRSPLKFRQSTGCGALIHTNGSPRTKSGAWNAKGKASDVVVPMDKMYFERGGESKTFACGCRWQGVGCSVW